MVYWVAVTVGAAFGGIIMGYGISWLLLKFTKMTADMATGIACLIVAVGGTVSLANEKDLPVFLVAIPYVIGLTLAYFAIRALQNMGKKK